MKYVQGQTVTLGESLYLVDRVYEISDTYMAKHELYYKTRVALTKISGDGLNVMDFGIPD